jgi:hypothetical protein
MRKKLLALLMCATMVLGSSAVAFAADVTSTDVTNATTVINQYDSDKGAVEYEYDAKKSTITFTTTYDDSTNKVIYTYAFTGTGSGAYVKTSSDGKTPYTKTSGTYGDMTQRSEATRSIVVENLKDSNGDEVANPSTTASLIEKAVLKGADGVLYYVSSATAAAAGTVVADGQYIIAASDDLTDIDVNEDVAAHTLRSTAVVVTLDAFTDGSTPTETGVKVTGSLINAYGIDKDGYIARKDSTVSLLKYSDKVASGYWVNITKASTATGQIAQALANGEISTSAVALNIDFYKVEADSDKDTSTETGFKKLTIKKIDKSDIDVKFNTDWLSRSNAKNANTVYVLQSDSANDFEKYFFNYGTVYKVSDLADNSFTTKLIASGTYIFDTVEDASQNDGVSDTDTTATTTASTTAATSPKTGDVAPIAALAVVMMGACGAMVVASKKRA